MLKIKFNLEQNGFTWYERPCCILIKTYWSIGLPLIFSKREKETVILGRARVTIETEKGKIITLKAKKKVKRIKITARHDAI